MFERYRSLIPDYDGFRRALARPAPVCLRANRRRIDGATLAGWLREAGCLVRPLAFSSDALEVSGLECPGGTLEWFCGLYHIQAATSMIPALALDVRPGHRVLDLCAAPGSKTTQLCGLLGDSGLVVANDCFVDRLSILKTHLERLGCVSVCMTHRRGESFPGGMMFDRVLADVPCSGEGTERLVKRDGRVARGESSRRRYTEADAVWLRGLQRKLLHRAANLVRPGGLLVYSTCTYAPEENELAVDDFLERRGDYELEPVPGLLGGDPGLIHFEGRDLHPSLARARRYYPHREYDSCGFFVARLRRVRERRPGRDADTRFERASPPDTGAADHERGLRMLRRFGVEEADLEGFRIVRHGRYDWLVAEALPHPAHLAHWRVQSPGLRLYRSVSSEGPASLQKLGTFASMRLGAWIRERVVDLRPDEVQRFLAGRPLQVQVSGLTEGRGYVVARVAGAVLGSGVVTREGVVGQIPKRYRGMIQSSFRLAPGSGFELSRRLC